MRSEERKLPLSKAPVNLFSLSSSLRWIHVYMFKKGKRIFALIVQKTPERKRRREREREGGKKKEGKGQIIANTPVSLCRRACSFLWFFQRLVQQLEHEVCVLLSRLATYHPLTVRNRPEQLPVHLHSITYTRFHGRPKNLVL